MHSVSKHVRQGVDSYVFNFSFTFDLLLGNRPKILQRTFNIMLAVARP